ncbi:MAG: DNA polymerase III subunit alpha [Patescibacteria group bacterium]|jgi:DNA polymerase-3 subunit alpha|nr:DNA polymerase III subunit alpha [Patescibacteria group bacterium]
MSFVHLHNHSHYSLLDGLTKLDELVNFAKEQGSPAVALTDHGTMYGVIEFYQLAKKAGIKPIVGVEAYLAPGSRHDKNTREDARSRHLVLLAKNETGYRNLIKLTSTAHLEGFYYKPRIDWEVLQKHHEGVIALSACLGGEIPQLIMAKKFDKAKKRIKEYNDLFGQGNYYLELQDHPELENQMEVNEKLIEFSKELNVPLVATNDVHYFKKDDAQAQDILLCLQNKKKIYEKDRMTMIGKGDYSMRPNAEMKEAFNHVPEAVENTVKIADACNLEIDLGHTELPTFQVPEGYDEGSYFRKLCEKGLYEKYSVLKDEKGEWVVEDENRMPEGLSVKDIIDRFEYELKIISNMGWPAYFLIVADFVKWARDHKIVVGPGRGSAAGSLVCYLTGITNLDPLIYDLLFERFLNPDRISMPDIDLDFADIRRGDVLDYVSEKYGHDHVSQIITFGTMAARAAVRDVGRVLDAPYEYCDRISKSIPMFTKIQEALDEVPEFKEIYQEEEAKKIIDYALRLEGVARHSSTHACGVLITPKPLTEYVPVQYASSSDKTIISQYSLHPVEDLGLLKMDFLGLKNLTIIEAALKIIKNTRGDEIDIDNLPLEDKEAYKLFQEGATTGVFQFESSGMKRYLKELKPTEFEDIIAMVALYRPGPMEWIPDYIDGKHGKKKVEYLHPKLEPILNKTYGVAIYQEQVMQISRSLAGFTPGEADILRKAMGKKIAELLAKQKAKFIDGCVKNGIYKELAEKVFSFIEPFAGYGFNRSHAACYALIGYQTAYLKAHYPVEFMAALLTADQGDTDRIAIEIEECRNMGISIMPPDINESFASFTVVSSNTKDNKPIDKSEKLHTIRFGLKAVKNVGDHIVDEIIEERKNNGPYKDIFDMLERITDKDLNKKSLESLIKCGALDNYGERGRLLSNLERLLSYNKEAVKNKNSKQSSLFADAPAVGLSKMTLDEAPPVEQNEKLTWEKELLGLYVSEHPYNIFRQYLSSYVVPLASLQAHRNEDGIVIAGIVSSFKKILTKKGEAMLFAKIEDATKSIEALVFPKVYKETSELWQPGQAVIMDGSVSEKDSDVKFLIDRVKPLDHREPAKSVDDFKKMRMETAGSSFRRRKFNSFRNGSSKQSKIKDEKKEEVKTENNTKDNSIKNNNNENLNKKEETMNNTEVNSKDNNQENNNQENTNQEIKKPRKKKSENPLKISINKELKEGDLNFLIKIFTENIGDNEVYFKVVENGKAKIIKTSHFVNNTKKLKDYLRQVFKNIFEIID